MICFLTSNIVIPNTNTLNPANQFVEKLKGCFPKDCCALFICSDPLSYDRTDYFVNVIKECFEKAGFEFNDFKVLDNRNKQFVQSLVVEANFIFLSGGHVPTQNQFFNEINLRKLLIGYNGVIIGMSAGSMNSADIVYAQPELFGEAVNPNYQRFLKGLNLTKTMLIPHFQMIQDDVVDNLRVMEDITLPDSFGHEFYAIDDGSYLYVDNECEVLYGDAVLIKDGIKLNIATDDSHFVLYNK